MSNQKERYCGSNSCRYATKKTGRVGTNGSCRCDKCEECGANTFNNKPHRQWCSKSADPIDKMVEAVFSDE